MNPEGAVKYSREDTVQDSSPAHEQTGASGGAASDLRPEGDIFKFDMLRPRKKLTNETWSQQPYLKFKGNFFFFFWENMDLFMDLCTKHEQQAAVGTSRQASQHIFVLETRQNRA